MANQRKIRIILTKIGLDVHDVGLRALATLLRDAGMEVIYLGLHQYPDSIVASAIQDDADVIGISSHCGAHLPAITEIMNLLNQDDTSKITVICGGIIPAQDRLALEKIGVKSIFGPGTPVEDIIESVRRCKIDVT